MKEFTIKELIRSKEEKRILTGRIVGIENEYYKLDNETIPCAILYYNEVKILIPYTHLLINTNKINKSIIRGMINAEIDFIVIEIDSISNIAIASRTDAMTLRTKLELPKLKIDDIVKVRIIAVGIKHIIVELYGKEVIIKADNLQHTYITNCKELYFPGQYLKVRVKSINIQTDTYELSAKDFIVNPYKNIRKYVIEGGEYTGKVVAFPRKNSGVIVQLDITNITCLVRVPAKFNNYPHFMQNVLIKITEINESKKLIYGYLIRTFLSGGDK